MICIWLVRLALSLCCEYSELITIPNEAYHKVMIEGITDDTCGMMMTSSCARSPKLYTWYCLT